MIRFLDLKKINARYDLDAIAKDVISRGHYIHGVYSARFEEDLQKYIGVRNFIGTGNGLDALRMILLAYKEKGFMKDGDEVIVPANTFIATVLAVSSCGLVPVLAEPNINTYNLDLARVDSYVTSRTKAIIVVHLYGTPCYGAELTYLAMKYGLKIIEDNAQAIGASVDGNKTGSLGDASALSFYPTKNLGALGDGGAVATNDDDLADVVRKLSNYGSNIKYFHKIKGFNSRLDDIQAAFLSAKLPSLDKDNYLRRSVAERYISGIKNDLITLPSGNRSVWHLFVVRTVNRVGLNNYLLFNGVETMIHYPVAIHKQQAYAELSHLSLPITEKICREVLSLPISPVMTETEVDQIIKLINAWKG
jgi:dTDP-4-amino-4,6-dideoxygalactose transaminase